MYLKAKCDLDFPQLRQLLAPDGALECLGHETDNVYEWMNFRILEPSFALKVVRAHRWTPEAPKKMTRPGPVYISGLEDDPLPEWLPQYIADQLLAPVFVYDGHVNIEGPDSKPISVVRPQLLA